MSNQEVCLIYTLFHTDEDNLNELAEEISEKGFEVEVIQRIQDLTAWMKNPEKLKPSLMITDISPTDRTFIALLKRLDNAVILNVHKEAEDITNDDNNVQVNAIESLDQAVEYLNYDNYDREIMADINSYEEELNATEVTGELTYFEDEIELESSREEVTNSDEDNQDKLIIDTDEIVAESPLDNVIVADTQDSKRDIITPFYKRSKNIQNVLMNRRMGVENSVIGIWSPLHRMGVTSFTINFAFYLQSLKVDVAVLEGLTGNYAIKDWLKRYTHVPATWTSYAKSIQTDENIESTIWNYRDVIFLPIDKEDAHYEWNEIAIDFYMKTASEIFDVTLVDFPTGEMANHTKESLKYCNELWIIVDDAIQDIMAWKEYILNVKKDLEIPVYLIFNKKYPFSQVKKMTEKMGLSTITAIPSLHEETMKNYYENTPLYFDSSVRIKLREPFTDIAKHLLKKEIEISYIEDKGDIGLHKYWRLITKLFDKN